MATAKNAVVAKHALSRRSLRIDYRFRLIGRAPASGRRPFDRHQPVRRMNGANAAPRAVLKRVFVIGRVPRALPGTVEFRQHFLGRGASGIDNTFQWLKVTGLVPAEVVEAAA